MPTSNDSFSTRLSQARQLQQQGQLAEAEALLQTLAQPDADHYQQAGTALAEFYLQTGRPQEAVDALVAVADRYPDQLAPVARLAYLLDVLGQTHAAVACYEQFVARQPDVANAWFNLALARRRDLQYPGAAEAYQAAIELGVDDLAEAWTNLGVLYSEMRQPDQARASYEQALQHDDRYIPALFSLAGLAAGRGDADNAAALYLQVLEIDPKHADALARWSQLQEADADQVDQRLIDAINASEDNGSREILSYALGDRLDARGYWPEAFDYLEQANILAQQRHPPYQPELTQRGIDSLIGVFTREWINEHSLESELAPIFLCGLPRSGLSLVEQMLQVHPAIDAGGEFDILPWLVSRQLAPYPQRVLTAEREMLQAMADKYTNFVATLFPDADRVTDRRADNFLHLGLLRALFPSARFVYTRRDRRDNCLSIWSRKLDGNLLYADDLEHVMHYYHEHQRLMQHWLGLFPAAIHTVDYENLVSDPEPVLRRLLEFLGEPGVDECLAVYRDAGEPLHQRSVNRWQHYRERLPASWDAKA
ncbi:MAG: tetratricopeptide repeat protein [Gammaproteobacteria bacterium]|nr:tetratricopeptide repeat protein [Gammaproteobacteria bacterium]